MQKNPQMLHNFYSWLKGSVNQYLFFLITDQCIILELKNPPSFPYDILAISIIQTI